MSLNLAHPVEIVKILQYICYCSIFYRSNSEFCSTCMLFYCRTREIL